MAALWATVIALVMIAVLQISADNDEHSNLGLIETYAEPREYAGVQRYGMPSIGRRFATLGEVMRLVGLDIRLKKRIQVLRSALNKLIPRGTHFYKRSDPRRNQIKRFNRWPKKSHIFRSDLG